MDSIATLRPAAEPARGSTHVDAGVTITIVAHPDPTRVGEMATVEFGADRRIALSRREPGFSDPGGTPRPLEDPHLSRSPVYLSFETGDFPVWADPTSAPSVVRSLHGPRSRAWYVALAGRIGLLIEPGLRTPAPRELHGLVGVSGATERAREQIAMAAASELPVLLLGETGTGKELLAHAIHAASARAAKPFVGVNIAAVPDTLLEAEFFGVAPGAYTGADRKGRDGKFKLAHGGTLFLDEIGDMPLPLQAKLLRVLQEQEVEPLGSNQVQHVDVRVIAATSRDLAAMVRAGTFRADLYYRLNVLPIRVPPLRERLADLESLADALADDIARRSGMPHKSLAVDALELLARQPWPGNIRELRNVLEQASLMTDDLVLGARHFAAVLGTPDAISAPLPAPPAEPAASAAAPRVAGVKSLPQAVAELEAQAIREALQATGGNKLAASRLLGISRATLYEKLAS